VADRQLQDEFPGGGGRPDVETKDDDLFATRGAERRA